MCVVGWGELSNLLAGSLPAQLGRLLLATALEGEGTTEVAVAVCSPLPVRKTVSQPWRRPPTASPPDPHPHA